MEAGSQYIVRLIITISEFSPKSIKPFEISYEQPTKMYLMDGQFDSRGGKWIERCHLNLLSLEVFFTAFGKMFK